MWQPEGGKRKLETAVAAAKKKVPVKRRKILLIMGMENGIISCSG